MRPLLNRTELTALAIVHRCSGQPLADQAIARFLDRRRLTDWIIESLRVDGLLVGGDDPDFPLAVTLAAIRNLPPAVAGYGCRCGPRMVLPCSRRWRHNVGMCGKCQHTVACHHRQPDMGEVKACLLEAVPVPPAAIMGPRPMRDRSGVVML
jgi:hypothetical protein